MGNSKRLLTILIILVLAIVAGLYFYRTKPISTQSVVTFPEVSDRQLGTGVVAVDTNGTSTVVQTDFQRENLPLDVRNLVPIDAQDLSAYKVSYAGKDESSVYGAEFTFTVSTSVHNLRSFFQDQLGAAETIGWKTVAANADDNSAFLEAKRDKPGFHLEMRSTIEKDGNNLKVKIELMVQKA